MERVSKIYNGKTDQGSKMVSLDYLFEEKGQLNAYQIVRFAPGEPWLVLDEGLLIATILKSEKSWTEIAPANLEEEKLEKIGRFIDKQHFNFLPEKIKTHWSDAVKEVIMQNDSEYLVICKSDIEFDRFKNVFSAFITELVEEEWAVEFKVYNANFTNEFIVRVF